MPDLYDLITIARGVRGQVERHPVSQLSPQARYALALRKTAQVTVDADLWRSAVGMMRAVIGPEEADFLFAFPYPDMVAAAFALVGDVGPGCSHDGVFAEQRYQDYSAGSCVAGCDGAGCDHYDQIAVAYERAGRGALWLSQVAFWARRSGTASNPREEY